MLLALFCHDLSTFLWYYFRGGLPIHMDFTNVVDQSKQFLARRPGFEPHRVTEFSSPFVAPTTLIRARVSKSVSLPKTTNKNGSAHATSGPPFISASLFDLLVAYPLTLLLIGVLPVCSRVTASATVLFQGWTQPSLDLCLEAQPPF
jgi:hypothetical protein